MDLNNIVGFKAVDKNGNERQVTVDEMTELVSARIVSAASEISTFAADTHLEDLKLEVREEGGDVWTEVGIPTYSTGKDNKFVASGDIKLDTYTGKKIQFAFHYKSSTANALRWQIQNVKVTAVTGGNTGNGGTVIEPTPTGN